MWLLESILSWSAIEIEEENTVYLLFAKLMNVNMLSIFILNVNRLSAIILNVKMLIVVAQNVGLLIVIMLNFYMFGVVVLNGIRMSNYTECMLAWYAEWPFLECK